jgi:glycosyltransferase involved in cell wall biosynthesis
MRNILIVDPRGVIAKGGAQTLDRHLLYAKELGSATQNEFRLIVVTKSENKNSEAVLGNLFLINFQSDKFATISFAYSTRNRLRNENIELMVIGDPWTPFYTSLLIRVLLGRQIPIQVQLHADLYSKEWLSSSFSNQIKSILSLPAIKLAKSVRFVSQSQLTNGLSKFRWLKEKSFVSPVYLKKPIGRPPKDHRNIHDPITLGVLGRIHQDRGLDKLGPLVLPIIQAGVKIRVIIAGEGQYKKVLQNQIAALGISEYFAYIGHLSGEQLDDFWEEIDVLISMAPSESYGRSIREALLAGVPIWALPSSGVRELKALVEEGAVSLINFELQPQEQISCLRRIAKLNVSNVTKEKIVFQNEQGMKKLIASWAGFSAHNSDWNDYEK